METPRGSRGSADTARDTRGFAVKFYTSEGNFDLVGNNIPVFFIQDGIKFPDLIHAGKPHPDREIPQAQTRWGDQRPTPGGCLGGGALDEIVQFAPALRLAGIPLRRAPGWT